MKKAILFLSILFSFNHVFSQVTTVPTVPTATNEITITLNTTGTGLENYTGDIYAHTGVTYGGAQWQNVISDWGENDQPKLTQDTTNSNLYTLVITPNVYDFYGVATTETITELCFVFRSEDGSLQTSPNIFVKIYEEGLNIAFTSPTNYSVYNLNDNITISAEASINADLELFVEGTSIKTSANTKNISSTYNLSSTGNHILKATANTSSENKETEISVYVKTSTQNITKPSNANYGVTINNDNSVTFLLKAPNKNDVFLIGDFSDWQLNAAYQMHKDGEDFWITIPGLDIDTEYAYQYFIDYSIKVADPYSEKILDPWTDQYIKDGNYPNLKEYPTNLTEGYVSTFLINETPYTWNVADFTKPAQDNLIIYELHIRDFTESDSYNEALTKLDYLESLGINAIELMPINEFEGADSWGYNPALYFALDKAYGTKNNFKKFVDECHSRGIAVLADVVFNHSYGQSPLAQMYWNNADNKPAADNPWYNEDHNFIDNTSAHWGSDFNHESTYTVNFFNDVLSYWINEYKIDGFRFDFTKGFSNTQWSGTDNWASTYDAARISILKNYADHVWNEAPTNKPYVIFEHLSDNTEETELANYGIMLWGNLNHNYNQNTMGWTSDTDVSWMSYKERGWNTPNVVGYMESHDEERLMYKNLTYGNDSNNDYNVKNLNTALARQELAGMFFFTIPGPKMIWQFGELGYDISIDENGRVGRKPIHWDYENNANRKHIYSTWQTLIEFKKQQPVFNSTDFTLNVANLTKTITLKHSSMDVVLAGNFDVTEKPVTIQFTKTGTWYEYFTGEEKTITSTSESITLNPGEYKLYSTVKLADPRGGTSTDDSDNDGVVDTEDLCPNTMEGVTVNSTGCKIFSLAYNNFTIETVGETCDGENNGQLLISAIEPLNYTAILDGTNYTFSNSTTIEGLSPGTYNLCITVEGETYEQCYSITIEAAATISGKSSVQSGRMSVIIDEGTAPYNVTINGVSIFETSSKTFDFNILEGDTIEISSKNDCEGKIYESINHSNLATVYPNPNKGLFEIVIPESDSQVKVEILNIYGQLIKKLNTKISAGKININIENLPKSLYIANVYANSRYTFKIIKN
ncbi:Por secretion system C-terminal sorting domain-containing protein [Lutibacter oricola]|uniref:Por secretion system C-terminal sorting domain-containing protein n=1 Tax=Lutibacter oricola TaxID=762486 RepID=A0A1H3GK88_9FLAO|nr:alpha-amylase family glycosyl hydrolase [Lutibacter oricola]SDY02924.1 Por secretion system C-terminal sorting domain-containing protein [Lutibacter oricola]